MVGLILFGFCFSLRVCFERVSLQFARVWFDLLVVCCLCCLLLGLGLLFCFVCVGFDFVLLCLFILVDCCLLFVVLSVVVWLDVFGLRWFCGFVLF